MSDMLPGLKQYADAQGSAETWDERQNQRRDGEDRRETSMWKSLSDNKIFAALVVALVLWMTAKVSGITALPEKVETQGIDIAKLKTGQQELRESGIKRDEQFSYIVKSLERLEKRADRQR